MSSPLYSVNPTDTLRVVTDLMSTRKVRKLPVIDNDTVIGIITTSDIVNQLAICTEDDVIKTYCHTLAKIHQNNNPYR